jgi:hypothetical protein
MRACGAKEPLLVRRDLVRAAQQLPVVVFLDAYRRT